jgi:hypothetical protein
VGEKSLLVETSIKISFCSSFGIATVVVESGYIGLPRPWHEIVILLLVTIFRYSLPIPVSSDYVLESTNSNVMSND